MTDVLPEVSCQHGIGGGDLESPADTSNDPACIVAGAHDSERKLQMFNRVVFAAIALAAFQFAFAQQTPPDAAASGAAASAAPAKVVKKRLHPLKLRKGAIAASNPETTPFKQGGE